MTINTNTIKVALAVDQLLYRIALTQLINDFGNFQVVIEVNNGKELIDNISSGTIPAVIVLDQSMPNTNGMETAQWLYKHHPEINILLLLTHDAELFMIKFLRNGVKGFLRKDVKPSEFKSALDTVVKSQFYYSQNGAYAELISLFLEGDNASERLEKATFTDEEIEFIKLCATNMDYKKMARKLNLNKQTIQKMRGKMFDRFQVQTRVGLAMVAVRHGMVKI